MKRVIYNTAAYDPLTGQSCGEPRHDQTLSIENVFADRSVKFTSSRPTIFMENLLTAFHTSQAVRYFGRIGSGRNAESFAGAAIR